MKEVYVLRHAEKDENGILTERGRELAKRVGETLPQFAKIISSSSQRTQMTAALITNTNSHVDDRAGFYMTTQESSDAISQLAAEKGITFFEAAYVYEDGALVKGINDQADKLNQLVDEILNSLHDDEAALIVSHDMTITPAMVSRGEPRQSIEYLSGYRIGEDSSVIKFDVNIS